MLLSTFHSLWVSQSSFEHKPCWSLSLCTVRNFWASLFSFELEPCWWKLLLTVRSLYVSQSSFELEPCWSKPLPHRSQSVIFSRSSLELESWCFGSNSSPNVHREWFPQFLFELKPCWSKSFPNVHSLWMSRSLFELEPCSWSKSLPAVCSPCLESNCRINVCSISTFYFVLMVVGCWFI